MFSRINVVRMPHKGWMKNDSSFTHWLSSRHLLVASNPNSLPDTSHWLPSLLLVASHFLIFHVVSNFLVTSLLRHCHLQHVCSFPPPLFHRTCFIQWWSLCGLHVAPTIFAQLFSFLYFVIFLWDHCDVAFNPTSIFDRSKLCPSLIQSIYNYIGFMTKLGVFHIMVLVFTSM